MGELEGEFGSGQAGDGDVRPGGEAEVGGTVPGQVDPASRDDTADQADLQSGGVDGPGGLDGDEGRVQHQQGGVAVRPPRTVGRPAGVEPAVCQGEGAQQEAPVPPPLHLHCPARPAPGQEGPGVAGADTEELRHGAGGGRHPG